MSLGVAILGLAVLIFVHESGHFLAARAVGMRPRKFYLGFPPALVKTTRGGVEYGIGAIPLGGYVKISGMNPAEELPPDVAQRAYYSQPVWKRIVVIGAGQGGLLGVSIFPRERSLGFRLARRAASPYFPHQTIRTGYFLKMRSAGRMGKSSATAFAKVIRSKGSRGG